MPRRKFPAALTCDDLVRSRKPSPFAISSVFRKVTPKTPCVCPRVCHKRCAQTSSLPMQEALSLHALGVEGRDWVASPPPQSRIPGKCLCRVYLQVRGEVAEWPKAAVC